MENTFHITFKEPKVLNIKTKKDKYGRTTQVTLILDWFQMGKGVHHIYKKDGKYVWTDPQSPIPVRKFNNLEGLMWEYELPKNLKELLETIQ